MSHHHLHFGCDEALAKLHHFVDEELHGGEVVAMLTHLEGCDSCAQEVDVIAKLKCVVREACVEVAPDHLRARIAAMTVGGAELA
ncbi:MAG: zf-HC2 domain-containing protein [Bifidobacteriaceae bacterium]|jgi:mycothiol system anti-sigma-R factor|nr:zf-HC2 domain-containing protein [Bifidobacteriaceae bacterium]